MSEPTYTSDQMPSVGDLSDRGRCVWVGGNKAVWVRPGHSWSAVHYGPYGGRHPVRLNSHALTPREVVDIGLALSNARKDWPND